MELTESLITEVAGEVLGTLELEYQGTAVSLGVAVAARADGRSW